MTDCCIVERIDGKMAILQAVAGIREGLNGTIQGTMTAGLIAIGIKRKRCLFHKSVKAQVISYDQLKRANATGRNRALLGAVVEWNETP